MPPTSARSGTFYSIHRSASELPEELWTAATERAGHLNTILSVAQKCLASELSTSTPTSGNVWITLWTYYPPPRLELVLACTSNEMGTYPIFIAATAPASRLTAQFLHTRLWLLADALRYAVPNSRVYSVFCPDTIAHLFAAIWSALTGIRRYKEPYYAAKLSICTKETLKHGPSRNIPGIPADLRLAVPDDLKGVADLCYGFASESEPFTLTSDLALKQASLLIQDRQVWVYCIRADGESDPGDIASIVACTRNSEQCATITKVYTDTRWRRRGCAERLVALYVARDNTAATKVYNRVGFAGLGEHAVDGVNCEFWSEIGFDREQVELGHW
ncbi:hypothetical protein BDZ89DRAFT_1049472 [Hymenopellis radicata]|nr:hypothetical protein BDZ89DRAFT_1049472 [Hymenopellis radicata]